MLVQQTFAYAQPLHPYAALNMHELAVTSGFAAAYRLGATYPFHGYEDCERLFRLYLWVSHGTRMVCTMISCRRQLE